MIPNSFRRASGPWVMLPSYPPGGWPLREWGNHAPPQQALEGEVSLRKPPGTGLSLFWFLDSGSGRLLADFLPARRPCASVLLLACNMGAATRGGALRTPAAPPRSSRGLEGSSPLQLQALV